MIYLDNHATTSCDPIVVKEMVPYFTTNFGNPSSSHFFGQAAAEAVYQAQIQVSAIIGGQPEEIFFTSGATESNNIALLGSARSYKLSGGEKRKLVTTIIEHKAVLSPLEQLRKEGWEIVYLPLDPFGQVSLDQAQKVI